MKTAMQEFSEWLKAYEYELPLELQVKAREALIKESVQLFEFWNGGIKSTEEAGKSFDQYINTNGLSIDEILSYKTPIELPSIDENTSDGYHTFKELYEFRKVYNAALFNEWAKSGNYFVHKSWKHHDGELCFGGGWFIVVAVLPSGQISNHYEDKDWDLFKIPETPAAMFEFDGHTPQDVLNRLQILNQNK